MLQLYGSGRSRWVRPLWMLRELEVPFQAITLDRAAGELSTPAFRSLNPLGKIPVLVDEHGPISESGAILVYLGDRFPERGMLPRAGTYARGLHDQRMFYVVTELEAPVWRLHRVLEKGDGSQETAALARRDAQAALGVLAADVEGGELLCGEGLTPADITLAHLLTWKVVQPLLDGFPSLVTYRDRLTARPAFPAYLYEGS